MQRFVHLTDLQTRLPLAGVAHYLPYLTSDNCLWRHLRGVRVGPKSDQICSKGEKLGTFKDQFSLNYTSPSEKLSWNVQYLSHLELIWPNLEPILPPLRHPREQIESLKALILEQKIPLGAARRGIVFNHIVISQTIIFSSAVQNLRLLDRSSAFVFIKSIFLQGL